jgi:hypothetical protein
VSNGEKPREEHMKTITVYEANDGTRFDSQQQAEERDALIAAVADAVRGVLIERPADALFAHDRHYLPHPVERVQQYKAALLRLAGKEFARRKDHTFDHIWQSPPEKVHRQSIVVRILDECVPPISAAWSRVTCIDPIGREWEQPYFADNPPKNATPL